MCAQILGFSRVRVRVSISQGQLSLIGLCASTLDNNVARHLSNQLVDGTSLVFATDPSGRNRSQCIYLIKRLRPMSQ